MELSYTNTDGLTNSTGTTNLDWTKRDGVPTDEFNYHKDGVDDGQGYANGGYPNITGGTSSYTDTSYKTGDDTDYFDNDNVWEQVSPSSELVLSAIAITTAPDTVEYTVGDTLDLTGMVVTATIVGNTTTTETITGYTTDPEDGATLTADDTTITVSYTLNDVTKTATQEITVSESEDGE